MSWNDPEYFRQRADAERALAADAANPIVADVHRHLAELYDVRASEGDRPRLLIVPSVDAAPVPDAPAT